MPRGPPLTLLASLAVAALVAGPPGFAEGRRSQVPRPARTAPRAGPSLDLITCDLDDMLWPTGPVVAAANGRMREALRAAGADEARCSDAEFRALMKRIRVAAEARGERLSYTVLRTLAIAELAGEAAAEDIFNVWLAERHEAADRLLFEGAAAALAALREQHPDAKLVALTNGRGDPLQMPSLRGFFDSTVSGEDPGIFPHRKPAPEIFEAALEQAGFDADAAGAWVHVGDCLINDVQASKRAGALTVWLDAGEDVSDQDDAVPFYSTISPAEAAARLRKRQAVPPEAIDERITQVSQLPLALARICSRGA